MPTLQHLCLAVAILGITSLSGCDWLKKKTPPVPSRPNAAALDAFPTLCYGDPDAEGHLVFLHGIMPVGAVPRDLDYAKDFERLAAARHLRIAVPRSTFLCRHDSRKICWGTEDPQDIAAVYKAVVASAGRCFDAAKPFGLVGFSNGGYHAARVVMRCLAPQPAYVVAIGSAGDIALARNEDLDSCAPLNLLVGTEDGVRNDARAYADRMRAKRARVSYATYAGGHVMPFAELEQFLARPLN